MSISAELRKWVRINRADVEQALAASDSTTIVQRLLEAPATRLFTEGAIQYPDVDESNRITWQIAFIHDHYDQWLHFLVKQVSPMWHEPTVQDAIRSAFVLPALAWGKAGVEASIFRVLRFFDSPSTIAIRACLQLKARNADSAESLLRLVLRSRGLDIVIVEATNISMHVGTAFGEGLWVRHISLVCGLPDRWVSHLNPLMSWDWLWESLGDQLRPCITAKDGYRPHQLAGKLLAKILHRKAGTTFCMGVLADVSKSTHYSAISSLWQVLGVMDQQKLFTSAFEAVFRQYETPDQPLPLDRSYLEFVNGMASLCVRVVGIELQKNEHARSSLAKALLLNSWSPVEMQVLFRLARILGKDLVVSLLRDSLMLWKDHEFISTCTGHGHNRKVSF